MVVVVVGQGQRGVLCLGNGRAWDRGQILQDVKTSASKTCRVPWTDLPQTERFLDSSAARCGGFHSLLMHIVLGLRSAERLAGRAVGISAITHLLPPSPVNSTKCPVHVESNPEGWQPGGQHLFLCISIISLPFWSKPLVPRERGFTLARTSLPTEQRRFVFVQQCPHGAIVPDGKQPRPGLPRHCWPLSPHAVGVQLYPQGNATLESAECT